MKMLLSKISNLPFLDGDRMYGTTNKSHFKLVDNSGILKTNTVCRPASSHFHFGDQKDRVQYQTETALSFPSHPTISVKEPKLTHLTMQITNFKMDSDDWCGDFQTTQSDFKPIPMSAAQIFRPTTSFNLKMSESKCPKTIYSSCYTKNNVLPIIKVKETANAGVGPTLKQDKEDNFGSSYHEQFQYRWGPKPAPLKSTEKQRIQYSSVVMGDREKILDKLTTYSISFIPSDVHCSAKFREGLLPKIEKSRRINLCELPYDKWTTTSSDEFCAHTLGPIHFERKCPTISSVFKGEMLNTDQEKLATANQCFYPKINNTQFPVHVSGAGIRTLSNVEFGRPNLTDRFYITTSQEQFPSKEVVRPKPQIYPPSYLLLEQEPDQMLSTVQKDFVPLNSRRQELSPSQLQQVKESHIRPRHNKHDFRTTHKEAFPPKPYCKAVLDNPPLQHISHMLF